MTLLGAILLLLVAAIMIRGMLASVSFTRQREPPQADATRRCESCGYDLRATAERCPECGELLAKHRRPLDPLKLRDDWPAAPIEPRVPGAGEPLVVVWHAPHAIAADLLVAQLNARGVPAKVGSKQRPMQVGAYVPGGSDFTVAVWEEDAGRAETILARFE